MKLRKSEEVLHEIGPSIRFSEFPAKIFNPLDNIESPYNRKLTLVKVGQNSLHLGEDFFKREGLENGLLKEWGGRASTQRRTSLFGNLGVIFGRSNMFLENREEEEEEGEK